MKMVTSDTGCARNSASASSDTLERFTSKPDIFLLRAVSGHPLVLTLLLFKCL